MQLIKRTRGFTIVELIVVITVIGVLATIAVLGYNGIQASANDKSVLSDLDTIEGIQTHYGLKNNTGGKAWYSGDGADSDLKFTPSKGNVIDVAVNSTDYCIRIYNISSATYKNLDNAAQKESTAGACSSLQPSSNAIANSPQGPITWKTVAAGQTSSCGITSNNRAYCWGSNVNGKLGNNSTTNSATPVAVDVNGVLAGKTIKKIAVGTASACVVASDDLPYCWGGGGSGQLGNNTNSVGSLVPVAVDMSGILVGKTVKDISVGALFACVVASDNLPYCWGAGTGGQLGNGANNNSPVPVAVYSDVLSSKTVVSINSSTGTCVRLLNTSSYCWGNGYYGDGSTTTSNIPFEMGGTGVLAGLTLTKVTLGPSHTCAVASNNRAYCWGSNSLGRLGDGTASTSYVPVSVSTSGVLNNVSISSMSIGAGAASTCVLSNSGQAYCWGANTGGALGNGDAVNSNVPVSVSTTGLLGGKTISQIAEGSSHACVLADDMNIYCWGTGTSGQLGNGAFSNSLSVVAVSSP